MKKLISLLKIYFINSFNLGKYRKTKSLNEKIKLFGFALLFIFISIFIFLASFSYSYMMAIPLLEIDAIDVLLSLMMAVSSVFVLIMTIYNVKGILFAFKDYDMQMSLPIKSSTVTASRILILYFMNLFFTLIIMIPAMIVYAISVPGGVDGYFYFSFLISFILIPAIPTIIATIIGLIINIIAAKSKFSNVVNTVLTFVAMLLLMVLMLNMKTFIADFANIAQYIMNTLNNIYPLVTIFTTGICDKNILNFLIFVLLSVVLFVGFVLIVGKYFKKINTIMLSSKSRSNYKMSELKTSNKFIALLKKELKKYFGTTLYVFNTGFGMVLCIIMSLIFLFSDSSTIIGYFKINDFEKLINSLVPFFISLFVSMSSTTCCAISLEGKNLWILKSSPIKTENIFLSKIAVNLLITIPVSLISSLIFAFKLNLNPVQLLFLFVTPIACAFFTSVFGLFLNLQMPNFSWQNEAQVIKQGMPPMIASLGGMIVSFIPIGLIFALKDVSPNVILTIYSILNITLAIILWQYIKTRGVKIFKSF